MVMTESELRRVIRGLLREAGEGLPPPDEPGVAPEEALGQYVMPSLGRLGGERHAWARAAMAEPDTRLEKLLAAELMGHYQANMADFASIWEPLMGFVRAGLYRDILVPPAGTAYRLMTLDPGPAARILGVSEEELLADPGVVHRAPAPPPWKGRQFVTSWTLDPIRLSRRGFGGADSGQVSLVLAARISPGDGLFLMNPTGFSKRFMLGKQYASETEVLGGGVIPLEGAAWIWWPGPGDPGYDADTALNFRAHQRSGTHARNLVDAIGGG